MARGLQNLHATLVGKTINIAGPAGYYCYSSSTTRKLAMKVKLLIIGAMLHYNSVKSYLATVSYSDFHLTAIRPHDDNVTNMNIINASISMHVIRCTIVL